MKLQKTQNTTRKISRTALSVYVLAFLGFIVLLVITEGEHIKERQAREEQEKEERLAKQKAEIRAFAEKYPIEGNLGGQPVAMPALAIRDLQYDDSPTPFSKDRKNYKPKAHGFERPIMAFDFNMNYKTGVLYESWGDISLRQFLDEKAQPASPWVFVGVSSGREAPKISMNKIFFSLYANYKISTKPSRIMILARSFMD